MSDEHRRQAEYTARAAADHGLDAELEEPTGAGTRVDVAVIGDSQGRIRDPTLDSVASEGEKPCCGIVQHGLAYCLGS